MGDFKKENWSKMQVEQFGGIYITLCGILLLMGCFIFDCRKFLKIV